MALAKLQAEMDKAPTEEHEEFIAVQSDLEQGLEGVRQALKVPRDYYAKGVEAEEEAALLQTFRFRDPPSTLSRSLSGSQ